ncbi:MAG: thymidine phosphorylase [Deltaproteobacteria bacterium]|nr:thymidine phosphorylase [Deltaproteobacteria bacterium]MBI3296310.1 thymidine phosphorylase [Deltaproteobacteria bacterium]
MNPKDFVAVKRYGRNYPPGAISEFVEGFCQGEIPDYQVAAWLMAVVFSGLSSAEVSELTQAMIGSGRRFLRQAGDGFWVDKHSTGGVGDKTSLILVPLIAATAERLWGRGRVKIPMVSGRGLGHTGGTLDKLESVPGLRTALAESEALSLLEAQGFFMMGQTKDFVPADRKLYGLRDVTATVESIPLIVSSIMSKKIAEGLDGVVIDLKVGRGAFMKTLESARALGAALNEMARSHGVKVETWITRMEEPLGRTVGNLIEVEECHRFLESPEQADGGLREVTVALAASMLAQAGAPKNESRGEIERTLETRTALPLFQKMLTSQGGDWQEFLLAVDRLRGGRKVELLAWDDGIVQAIEAEKVGHTLVEWGGGRVRAEDSIDPMVGIEFAAKVGDVVRTGQRLATAYLGNGPFRRDVEAQLRESLRIGKDTVAKNSMIIECLE